MRRVGDLLGGRTAPGLVALSAAGWIAWSLLGTTPSAHTHAASHPGFQLTRWLLMLTAMMPPVLGPPVAYIWTRTFRRRRWRAVLLFGVAYVTVWGIAGRWLVGSLLQLIAGTPLSAYPASAALMVAAGWHVAPLRQVCLNRCHVTPPLAAFGARAEYDVLRFGLVTGAWCVGSCWALMLIPAAAAGAHGMTMGAVTLMMAAERMQPCQPARWRVAWVSGIGASVSRVATSLFGSPASRSPRGALTVKR